MERMRALRHRRALTGQRLVYYYRALRAAVHDVQLEANHALRCDISPIVITETGAS